MASTNDDRMARRGGGEPGDGIREDALERGTEKPPEQWVTGDEPMTGAQRSYLSTLSREAGVEFDPDLTKAEASKRIDELQERTGRGQDDDRG